MSILIYEWKFLRKDAEVIAQLLQLAYDTVFQAEPNPLRILIW